MSFAMPQTATSPRLPASSRARQEQALIEAIVTVNRTYRKAVDRALVSHGLSNSLALPVMFLARLGDGIRQGVLAETLGIEGPSLVRLLDQLCAHKLVERRYDPRDGRAKTLHLTPAGHEMAGVIEGVLRTLRGGLLASISDHDLLATQQVLEEFLGALAAPSLGLDDDGQG